MPKKHGREKLIHSQRKEFIRGYTKLRKLSQPEIKLFPYLSMARWIPILGLLSYGHYKSEPPISRDNSDYTKSFERIDGILSYIKMICSNIDGYTEKINQLVR